MLPDCFRLWRSQFRASVPAWRDFSCVRDDGGHRSEAGFLCSGEDGKAGVRGRVVSKQGQIIAKSLMAGFLGGVSEAFDVNPVPVNTNPGSNASTSLCSPTRCCREQQ
ncbi:TrbI/VirB10 family protein [Enterobacter hormaechei]|uniref:TrbI/VirB10 family protein n=1 Tax=Enterobacter hormaechei TaxID=158836 RepID=UPI00387E9075